QTGQPSYPRPGPQSRPRTGQLFQPQPGSPPQQQPYLQPGPAYPQQTNYQPRPSYPQPGMAQQGNYPPPYYPGRPAPQRPPQGKPRRRGLRTFIIFFVVLLIAGGVGYAYYQNNYGNSLNNITGQSAIHAQSTATG